MFLINDKNSKLNKIQKNRYIKHLNKRIFWDINIENLDCEKSKQKIIERIAVYGTENDEKIMYILYPLSVIKKHLKMSDILNEKTISYFSFILNEKEDKFKCYTKKFVPMNY